MATITDLPFEMLSITAADSGVTNRDRKQARLACRKLAAVMTPVIFRRAYISRIKTDRDAFLSLAATPHLAAHVEEIIWFELEIDFGSFNEHDQREVELSDGRSVDLFLAAQDIFWLPVEPKFRLNRDGMGRIVYPSPPECTAEFLVQFKAAVARMPKLHTFASEQMAPHRIVSLVDGFPFEIGLLMRYERRDQAETWSDFLHIFLETISEEKGRINKLHCGNELSGSLVRIDPRYHAAMPYLISLELSIANVFTTIGRAQPTNFSWNWNAVFWQGIRFRQNMDNLRDVIYQASELRELNISVDCNSEYMRWGRPLVCLDGIIVQPPDKVHIWRHLRSLKLGSINGSSGMLLPLIKAHVTTLRHLHLDQCRPDESFAVELSQLEGLHLESIIISDSKIAEFDLVSEEELLRFIHGEDVQDEELAKMIGQGKFVTHNRRADILDHKIIRDSEADLDDILGQSSVWRSEADSDSEPDSDLDYEPRYFTDAAGQVLAELSF